MQKSIGTHFKETVKALISIIEEKDTSIKDHSQRVANTGVLFARKLRLPKKEIDKIYLAGLLHDIGIIHIPGEIIQKTGPLTEGEMAMVKLHPVIAEKIVSHLSFLKSIVPIIRHHHERYDGSGYPDALRGDKIPFGSRLLCLVDSYDAMVTGRSYRKTLGLDEALEEIRANAGKQFDPDLAKLFIECIRQNAADKCAQPDSQNRTQEASVRAIIKDLVRQLNKGKLDLPVLPRVIFDIQKALKNPIATTETIAKLIEKDAVVSLRLITVANSAVYRGAEKIQTVRQAVPRLGMNQTESIVNAIATKDLYKHDDERFMTLMEQLWTHSLACAHCSRIIAAKKKLGDSEHFFLLGLVHDIGKVLLLKAVHTLTAGKESCDTETLLKNIQEVHTDFGSALLQRWKFSGISARVAQMHEGPAFSQGAEQEILVVALANMLTRKIGYSLFNDEDLDLAALEPARLLEIDRDTLVEICDEAGRVIQGSKHIY